VLYRSNNDWGFKLIAEGLVAEYDEDNTDAVRAHAIASRLDTRTLHS
jgi:hypothetical protein